MSRQLRKWMKCEETIGFNTQGMRNPFIDSPRMIGC